MPTRRLIAPTPDHGPQLASLTLSRAEVEIVDRMNSGDRLVSHGGHWYWERELKAEADTGRSGPQPPAAVCRRLLDRGLLWRRAGGSGPTYYELLRVEHG